VPGARNAIQPGRNGLLLQSPEDGEELAALLGALTPEKIKQMSNAAPDTVIQYQWPRVLMLYEQVLKRFSS
jgi:hypothetical protein